MIRQFRPLSKLYCVCHNSFDNKLNFTLDFPPTAVANMAFMVLSVPLIRPRIVLQNGDTAHKL